MEQVPHLRAINPAQINIPNISQSMRVNSGQLLLLSGHVPLGPGGTVAGPTLEAQLEQVFQNMNATLQAAGTTFADVARLTLYVRDLEAVDVALIRAVRDRYINATCPPAP